MFGRRSMLLAHVRARHDGTVKMRVVHSPGGTNQVAEVVGWNGYRTCVAVTPRKGARGRGGGSEGVAQDGEDEETKKQSTADSAYYAAFKPGDDGEEKVQMDGDLLPATDDGRLYWPASDVAMQEEYKEVGDSQPHFSTFPSLPSPHSPPLLSTSPSFSASYTQPDWLPQREAGGAGGYFGASPSLPSSVWSSPPPVPYWQPPRYHTAPLHTFSTAAPPSFASPMHSPRPWQQSDTNDRFSEERAGGNSYETLQW